MRGIDARVDRWARSLRGHDVADRALYACSQAGNHSLVWHTVNLVDAAVGGPTHRRPAFRRSAVLVAEQALVNIVVKSMFSRDRPDHVTDHPHALRAPATSSFPSGHASAAACATVLLRRDLGRGPAWVGLAVVVAWSRIHVGAHHATDVAAGTVLGAGLAVLAGRIWPPPEPVGRSGRYRWRRCQGVTSTTQLG